MAVRPQFFWKIVGFFSPDTVQYKEVICLRDYEHGDTYRYIWQKSQDAELRYLIYRIVHCALTMLLLVISFFHILIRCPMTVKNKDRYTCLGKYAQLNQSWPFYLTRWGLMTNFVQSLLGLIIVWKAYVRPPVQDTTKPPREHRFLSLTGAYWGIHTVASTLTIIIDVVYWTALKNYSAPVTLAYFNSVSGHAANFFLMIGDLLVVAFPILFLHVAHLLIFGAMYLIVSYIYYASGGLDMKFEHAYLYPFVDWSHPLRTFIIFVVMHLFAVFSLLILMFIDFLKHKYVRPRTANVSNDARVSSALSEPSQETHV